ncbi:NgoPII family restriction endonuclease [Myxacorys almedinensis]|uniref:NgoPII family restriction endonuclease n=1 Tax=Myxacorys almedinensis A TaxID=2690445 RepID=A0A8J7Z1W7_9CYAN|nr:NgoPII family restriction endonuclease [Myxacorys almedinensis]NDJ17725.1 NgoPII family restriction endonuclease [Myxacorys almedinensis A]
MSQEARSFVGSTNVLKAIKHLVENPVFDVVNYYRSNNKINAAGDALELFVKDIFAGILDNQNEDEKLATYERVYSYFGNASNPPDLMIIGGDAIEVKKLISDSASIALNSSYPSAKLFSDSLMITKTCRICEVWSERDLIYAIGSVNQEKLSSLWLVYGDCYAASREVYEKIKQKIAKGVSEIQGVEFSATKELGRVNKVDPLGITNLRIRGMWQIDHPRKVYQYLNIPDQRNAALKVFALMREEKYLSFPFEDRRWLETAETSNLTIADVKIKSPDNPVKRIPAKLISFQI